MARILLAEDDEIMRITLYDRLIGLGYEVDQEGNGRDALARIADNAYHLIISDIKMPGMDGIKLLEHSKRISPDSDVILMTAYGSVEDAITCLKKGATDYVLKPFDMDDLTIRVSRILANQQIKAKCLSLEEGARDKKLVGSSSTMIA